MDIRFTEKPEMFGTLHLAYIALTILFGSIAIYHISNKSEKYLLKLLQCIGFFMIISEIIKQFFAISTFMAKSLILLIFHGNCVPWLCILLSWFHFLKEKCRMLFLYILAPFRYLVA